MNARRGLVLSLVVGLAVGLFAGCQLDSYELGRGNGADGDGGVGRDGSTPGTVDARPGDTIDANTCFSVGNDDDCDNIDDDCNGIVDDLIDRQTDDENCGACGVRCTAPGAVLDCVTGVCQFVACLPGFQDLDPAAPGCEYACPIFPPAGEDCNGVDEDCDGRVDEAAGLAAPPPALCRTQTGTPCAGVTAICATRGDPAVTRWYCDYPATVEFDPSQPNGILREEQRCDGADGDCDGIADDSFPDLGQECDDGGVGICRDPGRRACDPADASRTVCDVAAAPGPIGAARPETCNGLDDNCDGQVDNPATAGALIDSMIEVDLAGGGRFLIDTYEASRPDATAVTEGLQSTRSCSNPAVLPWRGATHAAASAACAAAGKQLCSELEWQTACEGEVGRDYPYGDTADPAACNAEPFDGVAGGADDDVMLATGDPRLAACVSAQGVHDLSGNLKEWTREAPGGISVLRGGAHDTPLLGATCSFRTSRAPVSSVLPTVGFRCCRAP